MPTVITKDKLDILLQNIQALTKSRVLVGIPGDAKARKDTKEPPNFVLGYINEFGEPSLNIPARPFLFPGVKLARARIIAIAKAGGKTATQLNSQVNIAEETLIKMGETAATSVRKRIVDGPFVPLAASTLQARARKGRKGAIKELANRALGMPASNEFAKPLIDTGAMRQSVTFVIDKK